MNRKAMLRTLGAVVVTLPLTACIAWDAEVEDAPVEGVSTRSEGAATYPEVAYWRSVVDICFLPIRRTRPLDKDGNPYDVDVSRSWAEPEDTDRAQQAIDALRDSWGEATGLSFTQIEDCDSPPDTALKVRLINSDIQDYDERGNPHTNFGTCGRGRGTTCTFGSSKLETTQTFQGIAIHEVGHALGLGHEHQRSVVRSGVREHEIPLCPSLANAWANDPDDGNLTPEPFSKLTPYDRCSIMNYCNEPWGCTNELPTRTNVDFVLTPFDRLGAEVLYPKESPIPLGCAKGCFLASFGAIVRSNGLVRDSWSARGANPWWEDSTLGQLWWHPPWAPRLAASEYDTPAGLFLVTFSGRTEHSGVLVEGEGTVLDSDSHWTAVAMSLL